MPSSLRTFDLRMFDEEIEYFDHFFAAEMRPEFCRALLDAIHSVDSERLSGYEWDIGVEWDLNRRWELDGRLIMGCFRTVSYDRTIAYTHEHIVESDGEKILAHEYCRDPFSPGPVDPYAVHWGFRLAQECPSHPFSIHRRKPIDTAGLLLGGAARSARWTLLACKSIRDETSRLLEECARVRLQTPPVKLLSESLANVLGEQLPITYPQFKALKCLIDHYPERVGQKVLTSQTQNTSAHKVLSRLHEKRVWNTVISMARTQHNGYGLVWPTT